MPATTIISLDAITNQLSNDVRRSVLRTGNPVKEKLFHEPSDAQLSDSQRTLRNLWKHLKNPSGNWRDASAGRAIEDYIRSVYADNERNSGLPDNTPIAGIIRHYLSDKVAADMLEDRTYATVVAIQNHVGEFHRAQGLVQSFVLGKVDATHEYIQSGKSDANTLTRAIICKNSADAIADATEWWNENLLGGALDVARADWKKPGATVVLGGKVMPDGAVKGGRSIVLQMNSGNGQTSIISQMPQPRGGGYPQLGRQQSASSQPGGPGTPTHGPSVAPQPGSAAAPGTGGGLQPAAQSATRALPPIPGSASPSGAPSWQAASGGNGSNPYAPFVPGSDMNLASYELTLKTFWAIPMDPIDLVAIKKYMHSYYYYLAYDQGGIPPKMASVIQTIEQHLLSKKPGLDKTQAYEWAKEVERAIKTAIMHLHTAHHVAHDPSRTANEIAMDRGYTHWANDVLLGGHMAQFINSPPKPALQSVTRPWKTEAEFAELTQKLWDHLTDTGHGKDLKAMQDYVAAAQNGNDAGGYRPGAERALNDFFKRTDPYAGDKPDAWTRPAADRLAEIARAFGKEMSNLKQKKWEVTHTQGLIAQAVKDGDMGRARELGDNARKQQAAVDHYKGTLHSINHDFLGADPGREKAISAFSGPRAIDSLTGGSSILKGIDGIDIPSTATPQHGLPNDQQKPVEGQKPTETRSPSTRRPVAPKPIARPR